MERAKWSFFIHLDIISPVTYRSLIYFISFEQDISQYIIATMDAQSLFDVKVSKQCLSIRACSISC